MTEDIGLVASELLFFENQVFYPVGSLLNSFVSQVWLGMGEKNSSTASDLLFEMCQSSDQPSGYNLYEIVLRTGKGAAYGGWVFGSDFEISDRFISGHRIIRTSFRGELLDFGFAPDTGQYKLISGDLKGLSTGEIRELAKSRQRTPR
ncbi:hypothetical protein NBRC116594_10060 [Shimia sp. NS0008-38b]|uniref:hypothetical protein n=1 Tax=Shimia sp. NS0008-38b TaxID=3127653 RepID=UPI00310ACB88